MCVSIFLLALIAAGWLALRSHLATIGSDVAGAVLSRALGGANVRVESVTVHGVRSVAMSGVQLGDGLSAQRVLVAYDFRSLLRPHTSPLLSVTAIRAEGVEADWIALQEYLSDAESKGAASGTGSSSGSGESEGVSASAAPAAPAAFAGIISIRDAVVMIGRSDEAEGREPNERRVELRDVLLEPFVRGRADAWSVAVAHASYNDTQQLGESVELADVCGAVTLSNDAVKVDDLSARLLGGTVRAGLTVARATAPAAGADAAAARVAGQAVLTGVSYNGWTLTGKLATCNDGRIRVDGEVDFSGGAGTSGEGSAPAQAIGSGRLKARLKGTATVPGLTPDATGFSADGTVDIETMEIGQSRLQDMGFEVSVERTPSADGAPGDIVIRTRAQKATVGQISEALGKPIPAQGWVEWRADGRIGSDGHALARIRLTDGAVRAEGRPDEWPHEFTGISGVVEVSAAIKASADANVSANTPAYRHGFSEGKPTLCVPGLQAKLGGGEVGVSGSPESWRVTASGVRVDHQLVSGLVDADLVLRAGERYLLSGRAAVRNARMDLVVAGIQSGVPVPEADLDVDIEVGENVRIVRGESWAWALPGAVHVQGSTQRPTASGSLNLSSGQIDLYGVPLEVVSGRVHFTGTPGDPPEFCLVARDVASGLPTIITVDGVPGDMRIAVRPDEGFDEEVLEGDLLVKLLLVRMRLYMLGGLGRALGN